MLRRRHYRNAFGAFHRGSVNILRALLALAWIAACGSSQPADLFNGVSRSDAGEPNGDAGLGADAGTAADSSVVVDPTTEGGSARTDSNFASDVVRTDAGDPPPAPDAPRITSVLPQTVVAGQNLLVTGVNLADASGGTSGVKVVLSSPTQAGSTPVELSIVRGTATTLVVSTSAGLDKILPGPDELRVTTASGSAHSTMPIFVVGSNGFGTGSGEGMFGAIYALSDKTMLLPNFGDARSLTAPCVDPLVLSGATSPCPSNSIIVPNLDVPPREFASGFPGIAGTLLEWFAIRFRGMLTVQTPGSYGFRLCSDDGSNFYVGEPLANGGVPSTEGPPVLTPVINNDGLHEEICASGSIDLVKTGNYPVIVDYFQGPRFHLAVRLYWTPPGEVEQIVPSTRLTALIP